MAHKHKHADYPKIALVGNPNSGKSSLFNVLTGLSQKTGNFPGVTVEKKVGSCTLADGEHVEIIDLPGTYSLYPKKEDEWVVYDFLMDENSAPEVIVMAIDATNIKRNLLFCSQVLELGIPTIITLTMMDLAQRKKLQINISELERRMGVPIVVVNPRRGKGTDELKKMIRKVLRNREVLAKKRMPFIDHRAYAKNYIEAVAPFFPPDTDDYRLLHYAIFADRAPESIREKLQAKLREINFNKTTVQADEITRRYQKINDITRHTVIEEDPLARKMFTDKLDNILLHRYWGHAILVLTFFLIFQAVFWLAQYPMGWIEEAFSYIEEGFIAILPEYIFTPVISNTFIAKFLLTGVATTVVFVPQIMILTAIITFMEDTGYMARVSFLSDSMMRKFGLNGKSLMPLISGMACAVPAVLAARNIENKKERLLTIFTVPFITCSARLPIFVMLTAMCVPDVYYFHIISLQGLIMMALYVAGFAISFIVAWFMRLFIKTKEKSIFILELPLYKLPRWKTVLTDMLVKTRVFLIDVGKIIVLISFVLTILFSIVPKADSVRIMQTYHESVAKDPANEETYELQKNADLIQHSYAARIGKWAEPTIEPLGYNWQIGVAVLASFAAREVFIGTLATMYSFEESDLEDKQFLRDRLANARRPNGERIFSVATSFSLLIFYMLAMQCMSTMAVVKRETRSWGFTMVQFFFMLILAYGFALITYNLLR